MSEVETLVFKKPPICEGCFSAIPEGPIAHFEDDTYTCIECAEGYQGLNELAGRHLEYSIKNLLYDPDEKQWHPEL